MIAESSYWKDDLLRISKRLEKRKSQSRWGEASLVNTEKDIFVAFFAVRKLVESRKVTDRTASKLVPVTNYPLRLDTKVTFMNRHKFYDLYALNNGMPLDMKLRYLCDQLVHSFVFQLYFEEDGKTLGGIYFCSDRDKDTYLYSMSIDAVTGVLDMIGKEYPEQMQATRDIHTGEWHIKMS